MMEQQLREILNSLYEAEALLEMAIRRPGANRGSIIALAREKCFQAADKAFSIKLEVSASSEDLAEQIHIATPSTEDVAKTEVKDSATPEDKDESELLFEEKIAPVLPAAIEQSSHVNESPGHDAEKDEAVMAEASLQEEMAEELTAEAYAEEENADGEGNKAPSADHPAMPEPEEVIEEPDYGESDSEEEQEEERRSMRIIDRRPIASFFSINDKFRFRRELFSNSNPEWLNALALLETMADLKEAEDYLFDDLQWDPESQDVQAFVQVLTRYYNS